MTLVEAAQNSVGLTGGEAARLEIWILVNDYITKAEQLKRLDEYLAQKVMEVPNVEKLLAIKGVGLSTVIGFVEYSCAAEPPVRCGESHPSGLTEPPCIAIYCA